MPEIATRYCTVRCPNKHTFEVETVAGDTLGTEYFVCPLCGDKFSSEMPRVVR